MGPKGLVIYSRESDQVAVLSVSGLAISWVEFVAVLESASQHQASRIAISLSRRVSSLGIRLTKHHIVFGVVDLGRIGDIGIIWG